APAMLSRRTVTAKMVTPSFAQPRAAQGPAPKNDAGPCHVMSPGAALTGHATRDDLRAKRGDLLEGDGSAGSLEGFLGLIRGFLGGTFQDGLGSAVHEVLGFLQAEGGQGTNFLDDLDLLLACGFQDDVELGLLFLSSGFA